MSLITLPLKGFLPIPVSTFADDLLVIPKKFPNLEKIERIGANGFLLVTKPFNINRMVKLNRRLLINLSVEESEVEGEPAKIIWHPFDPDALNGADGWIEGEIRQIEEDVVMLDLRIVMDHMVSSPSKSATYGAAFSRTCHDLILGFELCLRNPSFSNTIPEA